MYSTTLLDALTCTCIVAVTCNHATPATVIDGQEWRQAQYPWRPLAHRGDNFGQIRLMCWLRRDGYDPHRTYLWTECSPGTTNESPGGSTVCIHAYLLLIAGVSQSPHTCCVHHHCETRSRLSSTSPHCVGTMDPKWGPFSDTKCRPTTVKVDSAPSDLLDLISGTFLDPFWGPQTRNDPEQNTRQSRTSNLHGRGHET